jgi:hypothetical protein
LERSHRCHGNDYTFNTNKPYGLHDLNAPSMLDTLIRLHNNAPSRSQRQRLLQRCLERLQVNNYQQKKSPVSALPR